MLTRILALVLIFALCATYSYVNGEGLGDSKDIQDINKGEYEYIRNEDKAWHKIMRSVFLYGKIIPEKPLCDISWQRKICDDSPMRYVAKCFYCEIIDEKVFYGAMLQDGIEYLSKDATTNNTEILQLKKLLSASLPEDKETYDFSFVESNGNICKYSICREDNNALDMNFTGCNKDFEILITLIQTIMAVKKVA